MPFPALLTKEAAARALGVSTRTIDRLRSAGEIQAVRAGSQVRLLEDSISAYIIRQIPPTAQDGRHEKFTPRVVQRRRNERLQRNAA